MAFANERLKLFMRLSIQMLDGRAHSDKLLIALYLRDVLCASYASAYFLGYGGELN